MTEHRPPKPPEIADLQAHMAERSKLWKRPHLKPFEETVTLSSEQQTLKKNVVPALDVHGLITNHWDWGQIRHGNCTMSNATLWLSSDGTGRFYAYTKSDHHGDVWIWRHFSLMASNGVTLTTIGQINSPTMVWEDAWYDTDVSVRFPSNLFSVIARVSMTTTC
jgi:Family of unknown function (DUF6294)